ncbi:MAG: Rad2 nuclease [Claussenomyces sp. TS43310]|nr:MAG: Rad2 nuclease [Claussenomyces sp. TS43310]
MGINGEKIADVPTSVADENTGLLPLLKSIHRPCNLKKFAGQTIGVDAYGWLHRGTVACSMELVMEQPTRKFVDFAMHRVRMLQHFGVIPFLIFDGDYLPSKAATETHRAKRREESKKAGLELLRSGKPSQAYLEFQKAVDVTPAMARQLIDELKQSGVHYIVAPYEADAQMVYLERQGIIDGILSEDSDLLVFGAKCLLTKLDQYGDCIEVNRAQFCACRDINLTGWTDEQFRQMAILSGCDYLNSINNIGLKTAYRMMRKHRTIEKVVRMLQFDGKFHVPKGYLDDFYKAELTFLHQRVYCPRSESLVFHIEPEQPLDEAKSVFIGAYVEPEIAKGIAIGDLNPMTKERIHVDQNYGTTPRTPWAASRPQPRRAATSDDLKKGVSIERFFKPKRTPLAELDPNSFAPSPSQQELLSRNPSPWVADSVDRPHPQRAATNGHIQHPQTDPILNRSRNHLGHTEGPVRSEPRPSKRARLCADISSRQSVPSNDKASFAHSRFFAPTLPEPSPSVVRKARRGKREEINIFSDDSIEEALLSLPDFDGFSKQTSKIGKKIEIFDECAEPEQLAEGTDILHGGEAVKSTFWCSKESQGSLTGLTQISSAVDSSDKSFVSATTVQTSTNSGLKDKFAFTPSSHDHAQRHNAMCSTPLPTAKPSRIPVPLASRRVQVNSVPCVSTASKTSRPRIPSALQTLGTRALNRLDCPRDPKSRCAPAVATSTLRATIVKPRSRVPFPEVQLPSSLAVALSPADVPLPEVDEVETRALRPTNDDAVGNRGSEDFMIADSEEENDDDDAGEVMEPIAPAEVVAKIGLGRFAYTG